MLNAPSSPIGLVFDGERYHLAYTRQRGSDRDLILRAIESDGTLGPVTELVLDTESNLSEVSLAYDERHLLVVYATGPDGDEGVLDIRATADHSLVESFDLGHALHPRVAVNPDRAEAMILLSRTDDRGTYVRPLHID